MIRPVRGLALGTMTSFAEAEVSLRELLAVRELDLEVRAASADVPIRGAHPCELPDPRPYLLGGELLLTAGVDLVPEAGPMRDYVARLVAAGVGALGFGLEPVFHTVPEELERACARQGLALLLVPGSTPFIAVCRAVAELQADRAEAGRRRLTEAQRALSTALTGDRPREALLAVLAEALGGWVVLLDAHGAVLAGHRFPDPLPAELRILAERTGTSDIAATETADGVRLLAQPVGGRSREVLGVGLARRPDDSDRAIIAVALALLGASVPRNTFAELSALATRALLGEPAELAALFGTDGPYRIVRGAASTPEPRPVELDTPLCAVHGGEFLAVLDRDVAAAELAALHRGGWLAVTSEASGAGQLAEAARRTRALLRRARALGRPVHAEEMAAAGVRGLVSPDQAHRFAEDWLRPLAGTDLEASLRVWLANHGNWEATAAQLGVHRNTLRHRIERVRRLLGVDLADAEVRMQLWFALGWDELDG